ncbi:MAG: hypothetical protein ACREXS_17905 [Gammaproteobacteria bacterium]
MSVQAQAVLKRHINLASRHVAKQANGITGGGSTGQIHSLATLHKYTVALKQAGEWARRYAGLRYLQALTPALAQQYLSDRAAQGICQKQLDADRSALGFVIGRNTLVRETALAKNELVSRAYTGSQVELVAAHQSPRTLLQPSLRGEWACAPMSC